LGLLFYFKYANFFLENLSWLSGGSFDAIQVILPLGISFFTFQQIAFLSDCRNGIAKTYDPVNYGVFVAFFPQLVAGPIVHHKEMMPQFGNPKLMQVNYENLSKGTLIFMMGLAKKVVIADTFGLVANAGYAATSSLGTAEAWFTSLAYSCQLYFDFSGYSDMAIGLGLFFNIQLPINFNSPYKALSIQDFWRRWHMQAGVFLREEVFFPVGGLRKAWLGFFCVFAYSGFWHFPSLSAALAFPLLQLLLIELTMRWTDFWKEQEARGGKIDAIGKRFLLHDSWLSGMVGMVFVFHTNVFSVVFIHDHFFGGGRILPRMFGL
jgi:D-alanyl-lipoteichoic acid acyltransferase DltB (MBOAT superfamily)